MSFKKLAPIVGRSKVTPLDIVIVTDKVTNILKEVTDSTELSPVLLKGNETHFKQTQGMQFTNPPLSNFILTHQSNHYISNKLLKENITEFEGQLKYIQELLQNSEKLLNTRNIKCTLSDKEFITGIRKVHEGK